MSMLEDSMVFFDGFPKHNTQLEKRSVVLLLLLLCSVTLRLPPSPFILKRGKLETSGQRLLSYNSKTKKVAFNLKIKKK